MEIVVLVGPPLVEVIEMETWSRLVIVVVV
jgi:hypothetical protein